jgi:hypothetical protein
MRVLTQFQEQNTLQRLNMKEMHECEQYTGRCNGPNARSEQD